MNTEKEFKRNKLIILLTYCFYAICGVYLVLSFLIHPSFTDISLCILVIIIGIIVTPSITKTFKSFEFQLVFILKRLQIICIIDLIASILILVSMAIILTPIFVNATIDIYYISSWKRCIGCILYLILSVAMREMYIVMTNISI